MKKINNNLHLYYELSLIVNKKLYDSNYISFNLYKNVEIKLLEKIKNITKE